MRSQILTITRNDEGQFQIVDELGKMIEGPFETNAAAWKALDRIDNAPAVPKHPRDKPVLLGRPISKKQRLAQKKADRQMKVNAGKTAGWVRDVAAAKFDPAAKRAYRDQKLGTFGAASEVKRIDPAEYLAAKARGER